MKYMHNLKKQNLLILALIAFVFTNQELAAQQELTPANPKYYAMDREEINFEDIGEATLKDIPYKGRVFGIQLTRKTFSVYEGENLIATKFYGESVTIKD